MKRKLYKGLIVGLLFIFLVKKLSFFKIGILENIASAITYPTLTLASRVAAPIKTLLRPTTTTDIANIKRENEELLAENIKLKASLHHKGKTSELEDFQKRYTLDSAIFSKVLARTLTDCENTFILNRGFRDGVKKNMVLVYKFQLVGRVTDVYRYHSKATLITDSRSKIAAYTNTTNAGGIVLGANNSDICDLKYVSHLAKIEKGDFVLSSGKGLVFPEGFCLGKVADLKTKEFCHHIKLEPLVKLSEIEFCLLLDKSTIINF